MRGKWDHEAPEVTQPRPADNTSRYVDAQVRAWLASGTLIHPETAMQIAAHWQTPSPYGKGICAFAGNGTILCSLPYEIAREISSYRPENHDSATPDDLYALAAYVDRVPRECPEGLSCEYTWHDNGCAPRWDYADASGYVINGNMYAEDDAVTKTLWTGPDEPDEVWRRSASGEWQRER